MAWRSRDVRKKVCKWFPDESGTGIKERKLGGKSLREVKKRGECEENGRDGEGMKWFSRVVQNYEYAFIAIYLSSLATNLRTQTRPCPDIWSAAHLIDQ